MQTISLLQYVKDNSSDQSVQLPSFINYLKSVNLIEITKPNKLPRITSDTSYQDFINNLITELVLRKSQNVLVSGYKSTIEDSKVALPCVNLDGNFLPTNLNDSNWHRVFTLLGSEKFLNLLINHKGFLKHKMDNRYKFLVILLPMLNQLQRQFCLFRNGFTNLMFCTSHETQDTETMKS